MKSFLSYLGGKSLLADRIVGLMPEHECYCEVFAGAAWLLFKKPESKVEIINDINTDLVTLYRVVKHHLEEFVRYLKWILVARDEFERFQKEDPETLTDIQRSVRFYYLLKNAYSSKLTHRSFSVCTTGRPSFNLLRIEEELSAAHLRLSRVYIENAHYEKIINRFDRPHTFFYIDPPYWGCEDVYGEGIYRLEDFERLRSVLSGIKGKFILSLNDVPEVKKMFRGFTIRTVDTSYNVQSASTGGAKKKVKELLIMNYKPPRA